MEKHMRKIFAACMLVFTSNIYAQDLNMPKSEWIARLEPIIIPHLCAQESPFKKNYKGNDCETDVATLFEKCTTEVENVVLPDPVKDVAQANRGGQVISECINAYHHGGQALDVFNMIQEISNKR